uniref:Uncharacterized protein n=1 Tax=Timema monikensis TaxID=170555 RepID=A0A7R9EDF1_9NEOP|nr:unnamed protein product [Timema monikensis]
MSGADRRAPDCMPFEDKSICLCQEQFAADITSSIFLGSQLTYFHRLNNRKANQEKSRALQEKIRKSRSIS